MTPGIVVQHVDDGEGTVVKVNDDGDILVEWEDLSRTWENEENLRIVGGQPAVWFWTNYEPSN